MDDYGCDVNGQYIFYQVLKESMDFIVSARDRKETVYVHCLAGANRYIQ
jgi:protein-tyrosine phosphatase